MKAFVVVALFVASVAARSLDVETLQQLKERSLLKDDLLVKEKLIGGRFQLPKKTILGGERYPVDVDYTTTTGLGNLGLDIPVTSTWGQIGQRRVTVLSLEELVATPLFREYYNIPLFRQFLEQYPVVFRRYIESVLFQQFWTVSTFQQYFRNPVLFYKYIVPQVQVVAQTVSQQGIYGQGLNYDSVVDQYKNIDIEGQRVGGIEQYLNKNVYPEGREVVVGDYLNRIFNGLQQQNKYTVPLARDFYGYGQQQQYFGGNTMTTPVNYKFLLDRIFKTLFVDQPTVGDVTQVRTDVKIAPAQREVVVEPITGQRQVIVEEPKIVDVKVAEKVIPRTRVESEIVEGDLIKETLLKKLLVTKTITPEVYEILRTLPVAQIEAVLQKTQLETRVVSEEVIRKEVLLQKLLVAKVITLEVYETLRTLPLYQVEQLFANRQGGRVVRQELVREEVLLQKLLASKVITPEVYEILRTLPLYQIEQLFVTRQGEQVVSQEAIRKVVLLQKLLVAKVITPEVYEILRTLPISQIEQLIRNQQGVFGGIVNQRDILGQLETPYVTRDLIREQVLGGLDTPLVNRRDVLGLDQVLGQQVYGQQRYNKLYNNEIVGDRVTPVLRELLNTYGQQAVRDQVVRV